MKTRTALVALGMLMLVTSGCVSQAKYDEVNALARTRGELIEDLKARLEEAEAMVKALQDANTAGGQDLKNQLAMATAERDSLREMLAKLEGRIRGMGEGALPPDLDRELRELVDANPGLMTYDRERGMIRLQSDVTFALGSTDVKPAAAAGLRELAGVIGSPAARGFEAHVIGHTDNVPVQRVKQQHPTNWHLSVHRAIAVKDVLERAGVSGTRLMVAGYGEYRPVVPNGPRGAQENRRVEIFLVPSTAVRAEPAAARAMPEDAPAAAPESAPLSNEPPELFK